MPLAIVASPALLPDMRPAPGALDADLVRARLPLDDMGFRVVDVDPELDLAEQIDLRLEREPLGDDEPVLLYASSGVAVSAEGEFFLCLDPNRPDTGDALADVVAVLRERTRGPILIVLECRHAPDATDPFRSAAVVSAAKQAVAAAAPGSALLVAARPFDESDQTEDRASAFTRALLARIDEADAQAGLTAAQLYAQIRESADLLGLVPCFSFLRGDRPFSLVRRRARPEAGGAAGGDEEQAATEAELPLSEDGAPAAARVEPSGPADGAEEKAVAEPAPEGGPRAGDGANATEIEAASGASAESVDTAAAALLEQAPRSRAASIPPMALPADRSFLRTEEYLPRVLISTPPPPPPGESVPERGPDVRADEGARQAASNEPPPIPELPAEPTPADHVSRGEALAARGDLEAALVELKKALGLMPSSAEAQRAAIYVRIGAIRRGQGKRREAIASYEKALQLAPAHREGLEALLELSIEEGDFRTVRACEDQLEALLADDRDRFAHLVASGDRWAGPGGDAARARAAYEKARGLRPDEVDLLGKLQRLYEAAGAIDEAIATRRRIAELTPDASARSALYFELAQHCLFEFKREDEALEIFEQALEADPGSAEALEIVASLLSERQEWSELEQVYRRMLDRAERLPRGELRRELAWDINRRLGLLFRDHLEDPHVALDALAASLIEKPDDLGGHLLAADLARSTGQLERAIWHLQAAAELDPSRLATFHELFELFQRTRRPDQALGAAAVTVHLGSADARERIVFDEHRPAGLVKPQRPLSSETWEHLRVRGRDRRIDAVLSAVLPAATAGKLAQLEAEGRLPVLDPAGLQETQNSTVSVLRSFAWASHVLGLSTPAVYLREDAPVGLAAVMAEKPTTIAGAEVLRGRSLADLAFLCGRHLGYYVAEHRILLFFPSLEELATCFAAAVTIVAPTLPVPSRLRDPAAALRARIEEHLRAADREALARAVADFEAAAERADLGRWVADVERCVTRAGFLLCADLDVAVSILRSEPRSALPAEQKIADLAAFAVSDDYHALRAHLGIAVEP